MKKTSILLIVCACILASCNSSLQNDLVFIDLVKVYDQYHYSIELNNELKDRFLVEKEKLDQIKMKMVVGEDSLNNFNAVQKRLNLLEGNFLRESESNKVLISKKLNVEIANFCETHSYSLVLGATGDGSVLYGDKKLDITDKFLEYLNSQYEDK